MLSWRNAATLLAFVLCVCARPLVSQRKSGRTLVLVTLDGFVTALDPETGDKQVRMMGLSHSLRLPLLKPPASLQWSTDFGGPMISSRSRSGVLSVDSDTAVEVDGSSPRIVPGRDGSIMVASAAGLQRLPFSAEDLVANSPLLGASDSSRRIDGGGRSLLLGEKTTVLREVDLHSGAVLRTVQAASDACLTNPGRPSGPAGSLASPSIWLGRSDFAVRAYDSAARFVWNVTYSTLRPPAVVSWGRGFTCDLVLFAPVRRHGLCKIGRAHV